MSVRHCLTHQQNSLSRATVTSSARPNAVQRKCAVRDESAGNRESSSVPSIVNEALRSPGEPLDGATRGFMEARFGHDFSQVRVHADRRADTAARAVQAQAYTYGQNIVFGAGGYAPSTTEGKQLLAHELTHVVQQSNHRSSGAANQIGPANAPAEAEANRVAQWVVTPNAAAAPGQISTQTPGVVARQPQSKQQQQQTAPPPSQVNCPPNLHGAPADPEALLDSLRMIAILAIVLADADLSMLQLDAKLPGLGAGGGLTMPTGQRLTNYQNRWGLPPAAGGGRFRNRLSGGTFPSQAEALVEEAKSLQARYSRISDFLGGTTFRFRCITNKATDGGCVADCSTGRDAFGCPNVIFLCPSFWGLNFNGQSQLLIHEAAHTLFNILHDHNFRHADCYAAYVADSRGAASPTSPVCVP